MQLISTNLGGNLHVASETLNQRGLADYVIAMHPIGSNTIVVLRVSDKIAPHIRDFLGVLPDYVDNPVRQVDWAARARLLEG